MFQIYAKPIKSSISHCLANHFFIKYAINYYKQHFVFEYLTSFIVVTNIFYIHITQIITKYIPN